jgi:hypothetical protein
MSNNKVNVETETKITLDEFLKKMESTSFKNLLIRTYVPIQEKQDIMDSALDIIFGRIEDKKIVETDVYQEPNVLIDDLFINTLIIGAYTGINVTDKVAVYDAFMKGVLYEQLLELVPDAKDFHRIFSYRISDKREFIKDNQKSSFDLFLNELTTVVSELPKSFDYSSIQPFVDKINSMGKIDEKKIVEAALNKNHSLKNKLFGHMKPKKRSKKETTSVTDVDTSDGE